MSDNKRYDGEPVNYSDLIFDWGNPDAPVKKTVKKPGPVKQPETEIQPEQAETAASAVQMRDIPGQDRDVLPSGHSGGENGSGSSGTRPPVPAGASDRLRRIKKKTEPAGKAEKPLEETPEQGRLRRAEIRKRAKRRAVRNRIIVAAVLIAFIAFIVILVSRLTGAVKTGLRHSQAEGMPEFVMQDYLSVNSYSRPGISTHTITGIVVHNTAEAGVTAQERRDYFESLAVSHETRAGANFIVGLDGEVIVCVPPGEVAYASNDRNLDTVSVEFCQPDDTGVLGDESYASMVQLLRWLCDKYDLEPDSIIRHYDVTGKLCPKYYVENPEAWEKLIADVRAAR